MDISRRFFSEAMLGGVAASLSACSATPSKGSDKPPWDGRADVAQDSLKHFFEAPEPQFLHNTYPDRDNEQFNYWWLAHVVDVRVDAWHRTGKREWLEQAAHTVENIIQQNGGEIFNDYFDDMLWLGLSSLRLYDASGDDVHMERTMNLWEHINKFGWNDLQGESVCWRKMSQGYKNTPANAPFIILGNRLLNRGVDLPHSERCDVALQWMRDTLVQDDGFVADGINREDDGKVDVDWKFTYNQGVWIGALVETAARTKDDSLLKEADRTASTCLDIFEESGVLLDHGDGGDLGLFQGICYRYLGLLYDVLDEQDAVRGRIEELVTSATDTLWKNSMKDDYLLPSNDWRKPAEQQTSYSTLLSAMMAVELRARMEEGRDADTRKAK